MTNRHCWINEVILCVVENIYLNIYHIFIIAHIRPISSQFLLDWKMEWTKLDAEADAGQDLRESRS